MLLCKQLICMDTFNGLILIYIYINKLEIGTLFSLVVWLAIFFFEFVGSVFIHSYKGGGQIRYL